MEKTINYRTFDGKSMSIVYVGCERCKLMLPTYQKDKNGKDIFEGDIIKISDMLIGEVKYKNCGFYVVDKENNNLLQITDNINYEVIEVIGNIYENKELLE